MSKTFLRDLGERALKSFIQGVVAVLALNLTVLSSNPLDLGTLQQVGIAALGGGIMALLSFVTSYASKLKTGTASASTEVAEASVTVGRHAAPEEPTPGEEA